MIYDLIHHITKYNLTERPSLCEAPSFSPSLRTTSSFPTDCQSAPYGLHFLRYAAILLLLMVVGVNTVWGQITPGFYYLASNAAKADGASYSYNSSDPANSFYLCPAIGSYHDNNVDHPYLTTFKTNQDQNSLWKIEAVSGATNCYYLIHYKTGKYLASNATSSTAYDGGTNRRVVHLENKADDSDIYKFYIIDKSGFYQIYPADYRPGGTLTVASGKSLNVKADNWSMYVPQNGLATGIIGVYDYATNNKVNPGSQWKLEPLTSTQPCATPIVKYSGDEINISYPYTSETGITIYYTIDGTDPSTSSSSNASTSFNISANGVVKVRAFAAKSGYVNSDEAVLWGSARPFLIQSKECADYYLVPSGDGNNVNTSSLPGTNMQWTLQNAGASTGGVPYYYLVNSNGKKIQSATTLAMNALEDDNKFCVVENGYGSGDFFLIPINDLSKSAFKALKNNNNKKEYTNGNTNSEYNITLETLKYYEQSNGLELWRLKACNEGADQKNLFSAPPFSASTDEVMHYYHIESVGNNGYFIVPPSSSDGYARTSNTSSDYTDNPWIFKVAASDNWLTYYYIINAASGKFMFFNPDNNKTDAQQNVISMKDESDKNTDNEEKFQFIMVRSTTTDACYIVPKGYSYADASHKNFYNNQYFGLWRDDANTDILKTTWSRSATANNVKWTFEPATFAGAWTDPVVTCDLEGHITITGEDGATIYYTTDGTTVPTTESTQYDANNKPTVSVGITTIKVRAIASGKQPSNVVTKTIVYNPTITLTANSYTYTGVVQSPISSVDVTTIHINTSEYNVTYKKNNAVADFKDAGSYTIELIDADGGDYIVTGSTNVSIGPAALTITAKPHTITYGDAPANEGVTPTGLVNDETIDVLSGELSYTYNYVQFGDVGSYTITPTGLTSTNYDITFTSGALTVNKREVGLTWSTPTTFEYDGNSHTLTATATNTVNSDAIMVTVTGSGTNAGDYTATATGLTGDKAGNYSLPDAKSQDFTISKKAVTVTSGITATNKTYDGTLEATLVCTGASLTGKVGSEDLTVSATGAFVDKNVGTGKTVTISELTLGGSAVGNYTLAESGQQVSTTADITAKDITASGTINASNKVYDGTTTAVFDYSGVTLTGKVEGDDISYTATGAFADKNVGTGKSITIDSQSLSGADVGNYNLTSSNVSTTTIADITAAEIVVSGITAVNKVYNSTTTATLDFSGVTLTGKVEGDALSVTATGTFDDANVGTGKAVTISALTLGGTDVGNYELAASGQQTEVTADITAKAVTITANNASRDYDGNPLTEAGFTATALEEGDTHTFTVTMTAESTITNAGTQPNVIATVDGVAVTTGNATEVGNYLVTTVDGTLTINGTAITISVNLNDWVYGSPKNPSVTGNTGNGAVTYSYKKQTEAESKYKADKPVNVGEYTVKADVAATATTAAATATKNFAIIPASLTIKAVAKTKEYLDEDPELTYTVSGLKNNDVERNVIVCVLQRVSGENVGSYDINENTSQRKLKSNNYTFSSFTKATFTISKKNIGTGEISAPGIGIYAKKNGDSWDISLSNGKNKFNSETDYDSPVVTGPDEDGNYTITITGKGSNCEGTAKATYRDYSFPTAIGTEQKAVPYYTTASDLATSADLEPYIVSKVNPLMGTITIVPVSYIPKDVPVLLLAPSTVTGLTTSPKNTNTPAISESLLSNNKLMYSSSIVTVKKAEAYLYYLGEFVLTLAGEMPANRFYIYNPNYTNENTDPGNQNEAPSRTLYIIKDQTTGLLRLVSDDTTDNATDRWYSLDGRRLSGKPVQKGIYIKNGKKTVVK